MLFYTSSRVCTKCIGNQSHNCKKKIYLVVYVRSPVGLNQIKIAARYFLYSALNFNSPLLSIALDFTFAALDFASLSLDLTSRKLDLKYHNSLSVRNQQDSACRYA